MIEIKPEIVKLSNGIRLVYLHASAPVAHLGVTFLAGSRYENKDEIGLAHFLEHCIFKGTEKRKTIHILSHLDSVGGEINAYTTKEEICVYASFVKTHLNRASDLLADIAINSVFPEKEIEKEKEIVLDELNSYLDTPSDRIFDEFEAQIFPEHPLGNNILGTTETVPAFSKASLKKYVDRFFFVDNCVISFVGDIPLKELMKVLEKHFSAMSKKGKIKKTGNILKIQTEQNPFAGGKFPGSRSNWRFGSGKFGRNAKRNDLADQYSWRTCIEFTFGAVDQGEIWL